MYKISKYTQKIDWNITAVVIALMSLIVTVIAILNQGQIAILSSQIEFLDKENEELKSKLDPAWQERYNTQRKFFENEIEDRDKRIKVIETDLLSLKERSNVFLDSSSWKVAISNSENINNLLVELFVAYDSVVYSSDQVIHFLEKSIDSYRKVEKFQNDYIELQTKYIDDIFEEKIILFFLLACTIMTSAVTLILWYNKKDLLK